MALRKSSFNCCPQSGAARTPCLIVRHRAPLRVRAQASMSESAKLATTLPSKADLLKVFEAGMGPETKPLPPGPSFLWPLFGETSELLDKGMLRFGLERLLKYGPICKTSVFGMDLVMVSSPEAFKTIMVQDTKIVNFDMGGAFRKLQGEFNVGVLENKNGARMPFRRTLLAAVTNEALAGYVQQMLQISEEAVAEASALPEFEINVEARKWGMTFANALLAGIRTQGPDDERLLQDQLGIFFNGVITFDIDLPGTPLRKALDARAFLLKRIQESIHAQIGEILKETPSVAGAPKVRKNMLGYIIDNQRAEGADMSEEFLSNLSLSLLQAGTDTSAAGFASSLAILAQRPDVWEKIREEQRAIIKEHGPEINKAVLDNCKYLDAIVRECLRMNPVGTAQYRKAIKDMEVMGYRIPAGTMLMFNISVIQGMDVEPGWVARAAAEVGAGMPMPMPLGSGIGDIANQFDPDRFLSADAGQKPSLHTFGHGPHTCLGMALFINEAKTLYAHLVRSYDLELITKDFTWLEMPMVKPGDGVKMRFVKIAEPLV